MEHAAIESAICRSLSKVLNRSITAVTPATSLKDDLGLDSVATLDFFFELEQDLNLKVDLVELLRTRPNGHSYSEKILIRDIASYIQLRDSSN